MAAAVKTQTAPLSLALRLFRNVILGPGGCWLYTKKLLPSGYAQMFVSKGEKALIHRVAYASAHGEAEAGMTIDHLCRVRHCVNPEHLEQVTQAENGRRGYSVSAVNRRKTHCRQGHEFTAANTYVRKDRSRLGMRECRECRQDAVEAYTTRSHTCN